jgi:hypothetical protein
MEVYEAMRRFRDLLKFDPQSTPGEEQQRASEGLAAAVAQSHLHWWKGREGVPVQGRCLVLAVAPFSQYDLTLLDLLDERIDCDRPLPVYIANLQDYLTLEQLQADFPGVGQAHQTPIAALRESGSPTKVAWGKKARDLTAEVVGFAPDELSQRVVAESPRYTRSE